MWFITLPLMLIGFVDRHEKHEQRKAMHDAANAQREQIMNDPEARARAGAAMAIMQKKQELELAKQGCMSLAVCIGLIGGGGLIAATAFNQSTAKVTPRATIRSTYSRTVTPSVKTCTQKTDAKFYQMFPNMRGKKIGSPNGFYAKQWKEINKYCGS